MIRSASRLEMLTVRGLRYGVRHWGPETGDPILFLHGTRDSSATFQFLVDALPIDWHVIAPDWRGHGHSDWAVQGYWLHEFIADLDALAGTLFGGRRIPIVGHSLGGNIAGIFAGLRPGRLSHLVSLDGFGPLTHDIPVDVPAIMTAMLEIPLVAKKPGRGYASLQEVAARLRRANPRLSTDQALFLATESTCVGGDGSFIWRFDTSHGRSLPTFHTIEEWGQIWSKIDVPTLWISSEEKRAGAPVTLPGEIERRASFLPGVKRVKLPRCGHNIQHDEPTVTARLIERFLRNPHDPWFGDSKNPAVADTEAGDFELEFQSKD